MTFQFFIKRFGLFGSVAGVPANAGAFPSVAVANQYPEPTGHLGFQLYLIMSDSPTMIPVKGYDTLANAKTGAGAFVTPTVTPWVDSTDGSQSLSAVFAPA